MSKESIYIVLGGGVLETGDLPDYVISRLDLVSTIASKNDLIITSSSFSLNLPPKKDGQGYPIFECVEMAKNLKERDLENVICEGWSHDTIGSAIFCRMILDNLFDEMKTLNVVTSDFHFLRTKEIFNWAFEELRPKKFKLNFHNVKSSRNHKNTIKDRLIQEEQSINSFRKNFKHIKTISSALRYLLLNHDNYNTSFSSKNRDFTNNPMY